MNIKFSNKKFYFRHNNEIKKFTENFNTLHIINSNSNQKISDSNSERLLIDLDNDNFNEKINLLEKKYEAIIISDVFEIYHDIHELFLICSSKLQKNGKLIISSLNPKWNLLMRFFDFFKLKEKNKSYSYIHNKKIKNIAAGAGLEFIDSYSKQYFPFKFFSLGNFLNNFLESILFFLNFGIRSYVVFRKSVSEKTNYSKTIIIPAKNEEYNLPILFDRIPRNNKYEIIFSCGKSTDNTYKIANNIKVNEQFFDVKVLMQSKDGKANAVWEALKVSTGDTIAILDADISVEPEKIDDFFNILDNNFADFVNGSRLIYQMEKGAMRLINQIGNKLFQKIIGFIIKKPLTDSLCGTKVFKRDLIKKLNWWQESFDLKDPFGDFDLIFSAAYFSEKITELPIHYKSRRYGKTQISRFRDGFSLISYLAKSYLIFNSSRN